MGSDRTYAKALSKAFVAAGVDLPSTGKVVLIAKHDLETLKIAQRFTNLGFKIYSDKETVTYLTQNNINCTQVSLKRFMLSQNANLVIDTVKMGNVDGFENQEIRQLAIQHNIPLLTNLNTVKALLTQMEDQTFIPNAI